MATFAYSTIPSTIWLILKTIDFGYTKIYGFLNAFTSLFCYSRLIMWIFNDHKSRPQTALMTWVYSTLTNIYTKYVEFILNWQCVRPRCFSKGWKNWLDSKGTGCKSVIFITISGKLGYWPCILYCFPWSIWTLCSSFYGYGYGNFFYSLNIK